VSREFLGAGVCAVDLAGDETSFPMQNFKDLFAEAKKLGLPFTIHAGECGSVENVELAVAYGAKRIGHGIALRGHADAIDTCVRGKIGIEMCPISNLQTKASTLRDYPMRAFSDAGLCVTVNTDNRTVSNTTLTRELEHIQTQYGFSDEELYTFEKNAAEAAFADDSVKADLLRKLRLWHDGRNSSN
jgi:adenosine deaminase